MIRSFKVWNDDPQRGWKTHIEVDGVDVSSAINEVSISAGVKGPVTVAMDTPVIEDDRSGRPLRLVFPCEATRELLIKYGWTPPPDGSD